MSVECEHCHKLVKGGTVACPYYKGATICMKHCYECKHGRDWLSGERRCGYFWKDKAAVSLAREEAVNIAKLAASKITA